MRMKVVYYIGALERSPPKITKSEDKSGFSRALKRNQFFLGGGIRKEI